MNAIRMTRRGATAAIGSWMISPAFAQGTAGRPINFIVPQPAGNPTDGMARKVHPVLQRELGQPVVVENLPGAGGSIGVARALAATAATPVLLITSQTEPILTPIALAGVRYLSEQLVPVALLSRNPYILAGRPDLPASTLADPVHLGRQRRDKPLTHGHIGNGSMIHLLGEQFSRKSGMPLNHIPYKGVPPAIQDLLGGQIDLAFLPLGGSTRGLIADGKLKAFGTTAPQPSVRLPNVAPLSTQDKELAGFVYGTWGAVFVPANLPQDTVRRMHTALAVAAREPEVIAYIEEGAGEPAGALTLAELQQFYDGEIRTYRALAREIGVRPE